MKFIVPYLKLAGVALAAYAAVNALQTKFINVPVVGEMLPGYTPR